MNEIDPIQLSPAGEKRRSAILSVALRAAQGRRRRLNVLRGGAVALPILLAAAIWWAAPRQQPHGSIEIVLPDAPQEMPSAPPAITIQVIQTDPTLASKWSATSEPHVEVVDDQTLLTMLNDAYLPAGLAFIDGEARLLIREPE